MRTVNAYDYEAEEIEKLADQNDVTEAQIIQALLEAVKYNEIDIAEYI